MPLLEDLYAKQRARQVELAPFFYSAQFLNSVVAAGATVPQTVSINADAHFVVRYLNVTVYTSPGIIVFTALAALTINLLDTGAGRTLLDQPQAIQNICGGCVAAGTGSLPFILPEPWLIKAGGGVIVTLGNLGTLTFPRVDVSLVGFKVYRFGATSPADI